MNNPPMASPICARCWAGTFEPTARNISSTSSAASCSLARCSWRASRSPASSAESLAPSRWHPDIPIIEWVKPGEDFVMETYDLTGGFIKNNDSADDVRDIDLSIVHFLSGPIGVH